MASDEQLKRFEGVWAWMAITEPGCGSDSANIQTTARLDGDHYVIDGEKIFVTAGGRCDAVVVWATLDKSLGRAAIKSFVVLKDTPGMTVERMEHKLGIRRPGPRRPNESHTTSVGSRNESDEPSAWTKPRQDRSYRQFNKQPDTGRPDTVPPSGGQGHSSPSTYDIDKPATASAARSVSLPRG